MREEISRSTRETGGALDVFAMLESNEGHVPSLRCVGISRSLGEKNNLLLVLLSMGPEVEGVATHGLLCSAPTRNRRALPTCSLFLKDQRIFLVRNALAGADLLTRKRMLLCRPQRPAERPARGEADTPGDPAGTSDAGPPQAGKGTIRNGTGGAASRVEVGEVKASGGGAARGGQAGRLKRKTPPAASTEHAPEAVAASGSSMVSVIPGIPGDVSRASHPPGSDGSEGGGSPSPDAAMADVAGAAEPRGEEPGADAVATSAAASDDGVTTESGTTSWSGEDQEMSEEGGPTGKRGSKEAKRPRGEEKDGEGTAPGKRRKSVGPRAQKGGGCE